MPVANREKPAFNLNRQVKRGAFADVARVHIAAEISGRHDSQAFSPRRANAHGAKKWCQRHMDILAKGNIFAVGNIKSAEIWVFKILAQQTHPSQNGHPSPTPGLDIQHFHCQSIARFSTLHVNWACQRVAEVKIQAVKVTHSGI